MSNDELQSLYQELILDHSKNPHGRGLLENPTAQSHQLNPTCGDEITLSVRVVDGQIEAIGWEGHGCSISQASASLLATLLPTNSVAEAEVLLQDFRTALRSRGTVELDEERFGDAIALNGVSRYVARVKCAMLGWVAFEAALAESTTSAAD
jgi:nitrogen fixation NifU-like protein